MAEPARTAPRRPVRHDREEVEAFCAQGAEPGSSREAAISADTAAVTGRGAHGSSTGIAATAGRLVESLLAVGIDGRGPLPSAREVADKARAATANPEQAVDAVVRQHLRVAAVGGFVTGIGGILTLPVALPVNVAEFYLVATRMVAATASLRGYDVSRPEVRSAVLLTLVGADSDDLLRTAGLTPSGRLATLAAEQLPGPVLMVLNKGVGFRLVSTLGRKSLSRFGKGVPFLGGAVGAGLDTFLLRRIAAQARREFPAALAIAARP